MSELKVEEFTVIDSFDLDKLFSKDRRVLVLVWW